MNTQQMRQKAMMGGTTTIAGKELQSIRPMDFSDLACAGLLHILLKPEGYDPTKEGFEPLFRIGIVQSDPDKWEQVIKDGNMEEIEAAARAWGKTFSWEKGETTQLTRWIYEQSQMIAASMVVAESPKARRVRKASHRTQ